MNTNNREGFTLIEAIISVFILGIGIIALYSMQMTAVIGNSQANNMTQATVVVGDVIEQIIQVDFSDNIFDSTNNPHDESELSNPNIVLPVNVTSVVWNVTDWSSDGVDNDSDIAIDEGDESGMKHITFTINYRTGSKNKSSTVNYLKIALM